MQYRLRTLLIVLALGPPALALAWFGTQTIIERYREWQWNRLIDLIAQSIEGRSGGLISDEELAGDAGDSREAR